MFPSLGKYSFSFRTLDRTRKALVVLCVLGAVVFMTLVAIKITLDLYRVRSDSMLPAIKSGDRIMASRFSYGVPIPWSDARLFPASPKRGDIVVFPHPNDSRSMLIKRVVALGGESVAMQGAHVWINGSLLNELYAQMDPWGLKARGQRRSPVPAVSSGSDARQPEPLEVPEGHVFVLGDNRNASMDSRVFGFIPERVLRGKGWLIYFSRDPDMGILEGIRFKRFGKRLR